MVPIPQGLPMTADAAITTAENGSTDPLLQPFRLGPLTLRNRVVVTAHERAWSEDGMPTDRYRAYHVERARAGSR